MGRCRKRRSRLTFMGIEMAVPEEGEIEYPKGCMYINSISNIFSFPSSIRDILRSKVEN